MRGTRRFDRSKIGLCVVALASVGLFATACGGPNARGQIDRAQEVYDEALWKFTRCNAPYETKSAELYLMRAKEEVAENDGENAHRFATIAEKRARDALAKTEKDLADGRAHCAPYYLHQQGG